MLPLLLLNLQEILWKESGNFGMTEGLRQGNVIKSFLMNS